MMGVIIVDDAPAVRRNVTDCLLQSGILESRIWDFERADDMIERFSQLEAHLVIIEADPVGIDLLDAVDAMLHEQPDLRVAVVATEATRSSDDLQEALDLGIFGVLEKPLRAQRVHDLIQEVHRERMGAGRIR